MNDDAVVNGGTVPRWMLKVIASTSRAPTSQVSPCTLAACSSLPAKQLVILGGPKESSTVLSTVSMHFYSCRKQQCWCIYWCFFWSLFWVCSNILGHLSGEGLGPLAIQPALESCRTPRLHLWWSHASLGLENIAMLSMFLGMPTLISPWNNLRRNRTTTRCLFNPLMRFLVACCSVAGGKK